MERRDGRSATGDSFSDWVTIGNGRLVFVAGQLARDDAGNVLGIGDVETQARAVFGRVEQALRAAGGDMRDIVKITTFLIDIGDYPKFNKVRREFFPHQFPASTAVAVRSLVRPEFLIEVEAIAVLDR